MAAITSTTSSPTSTAVITLTNLDRSRLYTIVHRGHTRPRLGRVGLPTWLLPFTFATMELRACAHN
jgi:hypothetical protein